MDKTGFDLHLHFQSWNQFFYQIYLGSVCIIARPKGGLFRYHVKRIHFTMQRFGFVSAILDEAKLMAIYYYFYRSAAII